MKIEEELENFYINSEYYNYNKLPINHVDIFEVSINKYKKELGAYLSININNICNNKEFINELILSKKDDFYIDFKDEKIYYYCNGRISPQKELIITFWHSSEFDSLIDFDKLYMDKSL